VSLIIDACVAVKWFVRENLHDEALKLLDKHAGDLEAPDFLLLEVANVVWKKTVRHEITPDHARTIPGAAREFITVLHPSIDLVPRAIEIALLLDHPVYDCHYLACAEAADVIVITADKRFVRAVEGTEFSSRVAFLGEDMPGQ